MHTTHPPSHPPTHPPTHALTHTHPPTHTRNTPNEGLEAPLWHAQGRQVLGSFLLVQAVQLRLDLQNKAEGSREGAEE